ncbi:SusD/RagB family nutrient-binding outer membrane lipoprotein [Robertkochia solimangrovi]|uniref:SusD/RagB family nutrient-binding outer membrane lipoprotein n=1 Tax=Robertkochia solimangrovi TaxID=2213046 RepID=UPI00117E86EB|nr:SusD/RagB family nutrient-binding outer membrane lipoprotein [Robertkochia solimangrovi]TRZ44239.1 SusD/RagB family nutrient-binding outer membrane lipoprotein [Robertkochia solimangrovi]
MKNYIYLTILFVILLFSSCENKMDINRDPDLLSPDGIEPATELPAAIAGVAGAQGAEFAIIGGMWSQFWTQSNAANQYRNIDSYQVNPSSYQGAWNNMYDALGDIRNIKRIAEETSNWNYYLVATCLEVYASQILADWYDQIPYSEANDITNFAPAFNSGEEVYDLMISDLNSALSRNLSASEGNPPLNDDFIFGGDMSKWVQFANTLKLKIFLRQTEIRPGVAQSGIQSTNNNFLMEDAAMTQFIDEANRSNPLYESDRRQLNTATNLRASTTMYSYMSTNNDPRLDAYYGAGNPLDQGDYQSTTAPNSISVVNLSATTPVYFISAEHSMLMQAEALVRYSGGAGAKAMYDAALMANFEKWGVDATDMIASGGAYAFPDGGSMDDQITAIITQKWLASFPGNGFESFFEHNRTGIPMTSSVDQSDENYVAGQFAYSVNGFTGGVFPKRLPWPNDELTRNQNAPDQSVELTVPVWWDN